MVNINNSSGACPWCHQYNKPLKKERLEWTVIDEDFGQPVHSNLVHYCFSCGRNLDDVKSERK